MPPLKLQTQFDDIVIQLLMNFNQKYGQLKLFVVMLPLKMYLAINNKKSDLLTVILLQ